MLDLCDSIKRLDNFICPDTGRFIVPKGFLRPGFWAVLAAYAARHGLTEEQVVFSEERHATYASLLGLSKSLWNNDLYTKNRTNSGIKYSPLGRIDSAEAVDSASSTINSCIGTFLGQLDVPRASISSFANVIGELHDNVWSHGQFTGFSCAQLWKDARSQSNYIEFAVADQGLGLLREIKRTGKLPEIQSHEDAIKWCIQEGHSTKKLQDDDWAQSMPCDMMFNPLGSIKIKTKENNHQGLGLHKLVETVNTFSGDLDLITGDSHLSIRENQMVYKKLQCQWDGVAINCKFRDDRLRNHAAAQAPTAEIAYIMSKLRS